MGRGKLFSVLVLKVGLRQPLSVILVSIRAIKVFFLRAIDVFALSVGRAALLDVRSTAQTIDQSCCAINRHKLGRCH